MVWVIGTDNAAVELLEPMGEPLHIFCIGTLVVEETTCMQLVDEVCWRGGGYPTAIPQCVGCCHAANFLVLILKYNFSLSVRKGTVSSVVRCCTMPCFAKVIIFARK